MLEEVLTAPGGEKTKLIVLKINTTMLMDVVIIESNVNMTNNRLMISPRQHQLLSLIGFL